MRQVSWEKRLERKERGQKEKEGREEKREK